MSISSIPSGGGFGAGSGSQVTPGQEARADAIFKKQVEDTLENGEKTAKVKDMQDTIRAGKGQ